ncbi:hypothetical protein GCM10009584_22170 [Ornithinimicrobium humiphilum]|uniref:Uncharacterized protein n=1 Tax=Ornithinimicrobium humiphilum TaxID=125288 RepID=A0A543KN25_9MICO|nr:hypothetical protein [Ornithinimicrobium humiphilum]TQM96488.1 hypothetical protein FB476_1356 [Ornithinimicrobium humiphilum]
MTTTTIDCQTCPVRGRHCGDCFVPVLGRLWLDEPRPREDREEHRRAAAGDPAGPATDLGGAPLDAAELAAVEVFVRAGLVDPQEAAGARAQVELDGRYAVG